MATKIEAWVQYDVDRNKFDHADDGGEVIYLQKHKEITFDKRATLIIHDGPPERVYTESEVRALLKEVGSQKGIWIVDVQRVAERHGLASPSNPL